MQQSENIKNQINHYNKKDEYSRIILLYARVNENQ